MFNLKNLTIKSFHEGLLKKDFSAVEIVKAHFDYIKQRDPQIGSYLSLNQDEAYIQAEKADIAIAQGENISPIAGVPLAIKDNILIKGLPATAASKILESYEAVYDATVIKKLKNQKAVFLGKTNMDEFAMGSSGENSAFKPVRNPYDLERVAGGSSSGSAAAVADNMAVASLGSDTGGSIRQPAAFCGVVGLKPTYGAVSRFGLIAMASSLDQIGPITKTVEDAALLFDAIRGRDDFDSTSADVDYDESLLHPDFEKIKNMTIGLPKEYFSPGLNNDVASALDSVIKAFESLGIKFKEISLPHTKYAVACYYIIMTAEASTNLARYDGIRFARIIDNPKDLEDIYKKQRAAFGKEVKRRILLGTFVLSAGHYEAYYAKAQRMRYLIAQDFENVFKQEGVDVIFTPTSPSLPFKIGEIKDPLEMYLNDIFTIPVNLAGLPAISIPVQGRSGKLPVGFQLIGKHWHEADLFGLGMYYEKIHQND